MRVLVRVRVRGTCRHQRRERRHVQRRAARPMVKMGRSERRIRCGKICSLARPCEIDMMRGVAGRR